MRVGFLFNHDQAHQVAHSLPIALALAELAPDVEIVLATTNERIAAEVLRLAGGRIAGHVTTYPLVPQRCWSRLAAAVLDRLVPASRLLVYRDNLTFFRSLDALVVAEKTSLLLKTRYGLDRLRIVHTRHGAGDRAIGFERIAGGFDHVLVSGAKIRDRLIADAGVDPARISIVGYPKFDIAADRSTQVPDGDRRPVVLYNPHVSPHLSSWYRHGRAVLDWFAAQDAYRLIFAPHVMLFERPFVLTIDRLRLNRAGRIDDRILHASNILIDLGSSASSDMTYTDCADIYLGDVSSQVYEFLRTPRPCVFLNAHAANWVGNPDFAHWQAGPVIDDPAQLGEALALARADPGGRYAAAQRRLFAATFDLTDTPSSVRAAHALARILGLEPSPPQWHDEVDGGID